MSDDGPFELGFCSDHDARLAELGRHMRFMAQALITNEALFGPVGRLDNCLACRLDEKRLNELIVEGCRIQAVADTQGGSYTVAGMSLFRGKRVPDGD